MSKLPRVTAKVFASNAAETDIGQYGSALTGAKINTGDIAQIQALPAYETGWRGAVISERNYPTLQEMNGLQKVFSQQIAYLFQNGAFAEWDENTEYCANTSFCQINGVLYQSLTNNNIGNNPSNDETNWKKIDLGGGGGGGTGSGFSLFDVVEKDHILSFEESMGFGLLGTYVYKEPVAGSRYGYPDFYNRCVEEFEAAVTQAAYAPNVHNKGCFIDSNSVVSGFSLRNFVQPTSGFYPNYYEGQPFEMGVKLNATALSGIQTFVGSGDGVDFCGILMQFSDNKLRIGATNNGTSWNIVNLPAGTNTYSIDTDYWFKFEYTGTKYIASYSTDGETYTPDIEIENSTAPSIRSCALGNNLHGTGLQDPLKGTIDLKECYIKINNETVWQGASYLSLNKHSNGHIFYDIADKATVDEIFAQRGEAWFYGVDTENERIFLPRGTRSQYTVNTDETGDYVEAGLPNIKSESALSYEDDNPTYDVPPFVYAGINGNTTGGAGQQRAYSFDASTANPIYGNSDTVQPYATKKLLYIVVGNVKVQSAASDVVDVTTTENDTVPLFTGQYFNFKPNNPSWLKAGEQQDSGGIYTSCYNKLVQALTDNIWEIKVIDSTAMEEGTDYSQYWIVYQDAMRFRTPLRLSAALLANNAGCIGNGIAIGLTDGTNKGGLTGYTNGLLSAQEPNYGDAIGESYKDGTIAKSKVIGLTTDPSKSGIIVDTTLPDDVQLYFKVASAVENIEVLNVGQVMEELSNKVNVSNTSWATSACMPDYSAGVAVSTSFTAVSSGFITYTLSTTIAGNASINGVILLNKAISSNYDYAQLTQCFYCSKGDVINLPVSGTFYPLKGAIID